METEKLNAILKAHLLWLRNEGGERADLSFANLRFADLSFADLRSAQGLYGIVPEEGEFIAWKQVVHQQEKIIAKVLIPADSKRHSCFTSRKCRTERVHTLAFYHFGYTTESEIREAESTRCNSECIVLTYREITHGLLRRRALR